MLRQKEEQMASLQKELEMQRDLREAEVLDVKNILQPVHAKVSDAAQPRGEKGAHAEGRGDQAHPERD